jgi:hypothetical protein
MNLQDLQDNFINYLYDTNENDILLEIKDNIIEPQKLL